MVTSYPTTVTQSLLPLDRIVCIRCSNPPNSSSLLLLEDSHFTVDRHALIAILTFARSDYDRICFPCLLHASTSLTAHDSRSPTPQQFHALEIKHHSRLVHKVLTRLFASFAVFQKPDLAVFTLLAPMLYRSRMTDSTDSFAGSLLFVHKPIVFTFKHRADPYLEILARCQQRSKNRLLFGLSKLSKIKTEGPLTLADLCC